jgi:hypothetical protein
MAAAGLRRWTNAGRELRQRDPGRYRALLHLAEQAIRAHRQIERGGHELATKVRRVADIAAEVGRPRTRRDWGAVAVAAAERAGLEGADVRSLRTNLENQWRVDERRVDDQRVRLKRGDTVRLPAAAGGGLAIVQACRRTVPEQVVVAARDKSLTLPADLVTRVRTPRGR